MDKIKNNLRNITIAASSAIPVVGGPISVLLDKYLPEYYKKKRNRIIEKINIGLEEIIEKGFPTDIQSEKFISLFIKCVNLALQEFQTEKINAYKNIILNSAILNELELSFDETSLFINWIQELTIDQIRVIKAIRNYDTIAFKDVNSGDLYKLLKIIFPDVEFDYLSVIGQDLISKKIILHKGGIYANEFRQNNHDNPEWFLSNLGNRFIKFITEPQKTQSLT